MNGTSCVMAAFCAALLAACDAPSLVLRDVPEIVEAASASAEGRRWLGSSSNSNSNSSSNASDSGQRMLCPEEVNGPEAALDAADRFYEAAELPAALACAELAAEFAPQAIEAHHLRGAALATMGRIGEAQVAFSMALALDPDDPETLAAVADFYVNVVNPRSRDQLLLGLEYARRGSERAATRRRSDRQLRARLALLVGAGLNDLGSADLALRQIEEALVLSPGWLEAVHEKGVSLFNLCRFDEARAAFESVLAVAPGDPYANFYLGLSAEHADDLVAAAEYFGRAREAAPDEYPAAVAVDDSEFRAEVDRAISELDAASQVLLSAVSLEISALPSITDLRAVEPPFSPTIMGLHRGLPVGVERDVHAADKQRASSDSLALKDGEIPPRAIVLYRLNLIRGARTRMDVDSQIRRTLLHELGHARGLDEDELRRMGLE